MLIIYFKAKLKCLSRGEFRLVSRSEEVVWYDSLTMTSPLREQDLGRDAFYPVTQIGESVGDRVVSGCASFMTLLVGYLA